MKQGRFAPALQALDTRLTDDLYATTAERFIENRKQLLSEGVTDPKIGVVAITKEDRKEANRATRTALREEGVISGPDHKKQHLDDPKLTEQQYQFVASLAQEADDPTALLVRVLPDDGGKLVPMARKVLAVALAQSRREGVTEPAVFYAQVCDSDAVALRRLLSGTAAGKLAATSIARAQVVIKDALTNHAGRPKVSPLTRQEQFAAAQRQRYEKERNEKGRQLLHGFISEQAMAYLISVQHAHDCSSRGEAVDLVLCAASQGKVIAAPATRHRPKSTTRPSKGRKNDE